ncbi:hypothetical protein C9374_009842 [Naegleria lovaniensis]|uniref:Transmembrane protein n=1 Tax=Naegleria lovaniensis TaxID=51637 RepID=A0AA88GH71_NAELO|nr:uncharacterized protein C9374_009842 [Naegleria lovaniensis]KAG2375219.1 hypothetical protein C9374_009842 [Naegleria lovaniensis]
MQTRIMSTRSVVLVVLFITLSFLITCCCVEAKSYIIANVNSMLKFQPNSCQAQVHEEITFVFNGDYGRVGRAIPLKLPYGNAILQEGSVSTNFTSETSLNIETDSETLYIVATMSQRTPVNAITPVTFVYNYNIIGPLYSTEASNFQMGWAFKFNTLTENASFTFQWPQTLNVTVKPPNPSSQYRISSNTTDGNNTLLTFTLNRPLQANEQFFPVVEGQGSILKCQQLAQDSNNYNYGSVYTKAMEMLAIVISVTLGTACLCCYFWSIVFCVRELYEFRKRKKLEQDQEKATTGNVSTSQVLDQNPKKIETPIEKYEPTTTPKNNSTYKVPSPVTFESSSSYSYEPPSYSNNDYSYGGGYDCGGGSSAAWDSGGGGGDCGGGGGSGWAD